MNGGDESRNWLSGNGTGSPNLGKMGTYPWNV